MLQWLSAIDPEGSRFFDASELRGFWVYPAIDRTK